ncbi:50S ribosomal protein L16 [Candidatus Micrarchaeota archaeon]|nr:50S ribosomal protein L16 [Candidatus Micrarchaeota archaeon]MBU2477423.1 50S ribosomal protein L16 [Candidatus Micrarchaeota archaeon]
MGLRPGKCYRFQNKPSYTRVAIKVHKKNYIGSTPGLRTRQFNTGNPLKKYSHIVDFLAEEKVQIRDNSLESIRVGINRDLTKTVGKENFFVRLRIYPYQILRENKQAQGAGADRVTKGMAHPYGKPIGRAARVRIGQKILSILVNEEHLSMVKNALNKVKSKLSCRTSIRVGTDVTSIGTLPKRIKKRMEEKKEETAEEAKKEEGKKEEGKKEEKGKESKKEEKKGDKKGEKTEKKDDKAKDQKKK